MSIARQVFQAIMDENNDITAEIALLALTDALAHVQENAKHMPADEVREFDASDVRTAATIMLEDLLESFKKDILDRINNTPIVMQVSMRPVVDHVVIG